MLVNNAGIAYFEESLATPVEHLDRVLARVKAQNE
jgi:short-subunit dehydrogenase